MLLNGFQVGSDLIPVFFFTSVYELMGNNQGCWRHGFFGAAPPPTPAHALTPRRHQESDADAGVGHGWCQHRSHEREVDAGAAPA